MKIPLLYITLAFCLISSTISAQTKGDFKENSSPEFTRSLDHYLRMNEQRKIVGYRVQIFNGSLEEANEIKSRCLSIHPNLEVVVIFETPDYKLQAGNYRTILDAEHELRMVRKDFPGAFIVQTPINPPALEWELKNNTGQDTSFIAPERTTENRRIPLTKETPKAIRLQK